VIEAYETQIHQLHAEKLTKLERLTNCGRAIMDFDDAFRTAFAFLANSYKLWRSPELEDRRTMLRLTFGEQPAYRRNEGFRTAKTTLPFKILQQISAGNSGLVDLDEEESNRLFAVLKDWNTILQAGDMKQFSGYRDA